MRWIAAALLFACITSRIDAQNAAPRIRYGGFGDVVFAHVNSRGTTAFDTGEIDVFVTARLSDDWSLLAEGFLQEVRRAGDVDLPSTKHLELDVERLNAVYNPSDLLRLEMGQIHTGIIRWNAREHRGRFL